MKTFDHLVIDNPIEMNTVEIDGKRYYVTPEGNNYPSLTTVISNNSKKQASLAKWRARVGKEKASGCLNSFSDKRHSLPQTGRRLS